MALDDTDADNAALQYVVGSHKLGVVPFETSKAGERNVLNLTVANAEAMGEVVCNTLKAGEISLHDPLILHGSEPNHSTRRRMGLTLRYAPAHVSARLGDEDWFFKGTVVAGVDRSRKWADAPRPEKE